MTRETAPLEEIGAEAPALQSALLRGHEECGAFDDPREYADCARFWDAAAVMESYGLRLTTVHDEGVLCRECGEAVEDLPEHLSGHGTPVEKYRERHPVAPVAPRERALVPPADPDW